jgi:hypothetical protein
MVLGHQMPACKGAPGNRHLRIALQGFPLLDTWYMSDGGYVKTQTYADSCMLMLGISLQFQKRLLGKGMNSPTQNALCPGAQYLTICTVGGFWFWRHAQSAGCLCSSS